MVVDPIIPLSVSIAEGNGNYAIFLGSGASTEAGILTGTEIFNQTVEGLYKLEKDVKEIDNHEKFERWLESSKLKESNYSNILETLCLTPADRNKFLEKYFIGKKPIKTHYLIAEMVKNGLIRVIVTTNFDRLLETVLDELNIPYTRVSSVDELKTSKHREHSNCYILKLHGDFKQITIKNTPEEVKKLDEEIEKDFQEILDRYGMLVIGYGGNDEGVMNCFKERKSRYTLYWTRKNTITEEVEDLIKAQDGRIIKRDSAEKFLEELSRKISIFQTHKTGETPEYIMQKVKDYIRNKDDVGIKETLKEEMNSIRKHWFKICEKTASYTQIDDPIIYFKEFEEYCNKITAIGLILLEYSPKLFSEIPKYLQKIYDLQFETGDRSIFHNEFIKKIPEGIIHNIYYCLGSFAIKEEKFEELKILLNTELISKSPHNLESNKIWITECFYPTIFNGNTFTVFKFLTKSYSDKDFLTMFFYSADEFFTFLCEFNLIICLYSAKMHLKDSELYGIVYPNFATAPRSIHQLIIFRLSQPEFQNKIAEAFGEDKDQFILNYPERADKINNIERGYGFRKLPNNL